MNEVGPEADPFEGLANGIHHGRRTADEHGRFAAASGENVLQHASIQVTGTAFEIPLSRQDVVDGEVWQLGFDGLQLIAAQNVGLGFVAPHKRRLSRVTRVDHVSEHAEHGRHPHPAGDQDQLSIRVPDVRQIAEQPVRPVDEGGIAGLKTADKGSKIPAALDGEYEALGPRGS